MKKTLIATLLILSSTISLANARFFIGIDGGYSMDRIGVETELKKDFIISWGTKTNNAYKGNGYVLNLNLGTQHYFDENDLIGLRWVFSSGYRKADLINQVNKLEYSSNIFTLSLGGDMLFGLVKFSNHSFGAFVGLEEQFATIASDSYDYRLFPDLSIERDRIFASITFSTQARIGLSLFLAQHHRIEFIAKIPFFSITGVNGETYTYKPIQFMLGYKFVF